MSDVMNLKPDNVTVSRREVLKRGTFATLGLTVLGAVSACQSHEEEHPKITHGVVNIGPATEYLAGSVSEKYRATYGIDISNDGGTITAISPVCTHRGCLVKWDADHSKFECPCHGSEFNIQGMVLEGPAKRPLARVPTIQNPDGTLSVDLDRLPQPKAKGSEQA